MAVKVNTYEFENQRPNEEIILMRRRHPWVLFRTGLYVLLAIVLVFIAFLIWGASKVSVIILIASSIISLSFLIIRWFVYNNDIYILTNHRIINIDQSGFFLRRVSEAELVNIQNVSYEIKGPIKSLLNFGTIEISTAGNTIGLVLKNVENPHFVQEKIVALQTKAKS